MLASRELPSLRAALAELPGGEVRECLAAGVLAVLMLGALAMHLKVKDPVSKSVPAAAMLAMTAALAWMKLGR